MSVTALQIIVGGIVTLFLGVIGVRASRKKDASDEWRGLYDEMRSRVERLEEQADEQKEEMRIMERALRNMWDGNRRNIEQLRELDQTPRYEPPGVNFRGEDKPFSQRKD